MNKPALSNGVRIDDTYFTAIIQRLGGVIAIVLVVFCGLPALTARETAVLNPLDMYSELLPGQPINRVGGAGLSCTFGAYCTQTVSGGAVKSVEVLLQNETVSRLNIWLRDESMRLGDLVLWWGNPCRRIAGNTIELWWPDLRITATGSLTASRYFSAIRRISVHHESLNGIYNADRAERCGTDASAVTTE